MKKRLFSIMLFLYLCMGLTIPVMAAEPEAAPDYSASTWTNHTAYGLSGITISKSSKTADKEAFEEATSLTVFSQKQVFAIGDSLKGGVFEFEGQHRDCCISGEIYQYNIGGNRIVANRGDKTRKDEATKSWAELGFGVYTPNGAELLPPSAASIAFANDDKRTFLITPKAGNGKTFDNISTIGMEQIFYLKTCVGLYDWDFKELLSPKTYALIEYMQDGYYLIREGHADADGTCYWSYGIINMEPAWSSPVSGKLAFPILVRICSGLGQRRSVMALLMGAAGRFFRQFTLESAPTATDISLQLSPEANSIASGQSK